MRARSRAAPRSLPPWLAAALPSLPPDAPYLLRLLAALRQWHAISSASDAMPASGDAGGHGACAPPAPLLSLLDTLRSAERFYDVLGGAAGYQLTALELVQASCGAASALRVGGGGGGPLSDDPDEVRDGADVAYHAPRGPHLGDPSCASTAALAAAAGLRAMPRLAELYPLGGAGDRLGLVDETTGEPLPAALLPYGGRTLLACLLRDLAAREWLHFRCLGVQLATPVAMMTSAAKGNHARVAALCAAERWFGRGSAGFRLFKQPLVPVLAAASGRWLLEAPGTLALKPGGHGVVWKLAADTGVLDWLHSRGASAALVRQISNPLAGTDATLLALAGVGDAGGRAFGFAACDRSVGASEGVVVLRERRLPGGGGCEYNVSNVEYTEFERLGIDDTPSDAAHGKSALPANTNVLYASLAAVRTALAAGPAGAFPGLLVNLSKPSASYGEAAPVRGGRLECSMQAIADCMAKNVAQPLPPAQWDALPTFAVFAPRRRVTSSAKRRRQPGSARLAQTPEGSFLDLLRNGREWLTLGGVACPPIGPDADFATGAPPPFLLRHHPALGPLWSVAAQKVRGSTLAAGSELELELAEADVEGLRLEGSLLVTATQPLGPERPDASGESVVRYCGARAARLRLRDVAVRNAGVDWAAPGNVYWAARVARRQAAVVTLRGDAELDAEGVDLAGDVALDVPPGHRLTLRPAKAGGPRGDYTAVLTPLSIDAATGAPQPSWAWRYQLGDDGGVRLTRHAPPYGPWLALAPRE